MFNKSISKEDLAQMPIRYYEGSIILIDRREDIPAAMKIIMQCPVCGVDTETLPSFKKGEKNAVALIQIAIPDTVYLIRINKTGLTDEIVRFFESPDILKVGIALKDDMRDLNKVKPLTSRNILDLNEYVKKRGFENFGAKKLSALVLGFRISKNQQTSNWESPILTDAQIRYAATDAWVCREIYLSLQQEENQHPKEQ